MPPDNLSALICAAVRSRASQVPSAPTLTCRAVEWRPACSPGRRRPTTWAWWDTSSIAPRRRSGVGSRAHELADVDGHVRSRRASATTTTCVPYDAAGNLSGRSSHRVHRRAMRMRREDDARRCGWPRAWRRGAPARRRRRSRCRRFERVMTMSPPRVVGDLAMTDQNGEQRASATSPARPRWCSSGSRIARTSARRRCRSWR